jgi:acyl-CoA synthetase (AMP-forming)/AMP-acid ligase II
VSHFVAKTLVESLREVAEITDRGYTHVVDEKKPREFVSYAEMWRRASQFAAALQDRGLRKGDRVGLILPDSAQFIDAIYGAMIAGVVPVPIYPPMNLGQLDGYLQNTAHILGRAGCKLVVTDDRVRPVLGKILDTAASIRAIETMTRLLAGVAPNAAPRAVDVFPSDIAFLQFTSGSTARPKGVTLTHENLVANIEAIGGPAGISLNSETIGYSWLPLYHDMGLIGFVFTPVHSKVRGVHFMSPLTFLKRPASWIRGMSEARATVTFAPNFAYGLAVARVKPTEIEGADLSSLHVAGCGAEPIQFATLRAFAERYRGHGFRSSAFLPCYGMAEHSLAVTFIGLAEDLTADRVDTEAMAQGEARPAAPAQAENVTEVVSCGRPFPGHEVRILDERGQPLGDRRVGEIVLKGPSVMVGYFEDDDATREALRDGWLHSGDLGYLANGELYVCGRIKDLIIVNGRNYYPQDLEWLASQVDGVRKGNVVAFGLTDPADEAARERVIVCAEVRAEEESERIRKDIAEKIAMGLGLKVDELLLLPPGSLPKTSSGKLQRRKTQQLFLDAALAKNAGQASTWGLVKHLAASRWSYLKNTLLRPRDDG